jgi:spore coat polysaccharide biosynthesis protein SpsF
MKVLVISQARIGSTRLPSKVLKKIGDESLLEIHINRILKSTLISKLIIATTIEKEDISIVNLAKELGVESSRGSVNDVLDRYYQAAKQYNPKWIVRVTSDCPLIDPNLLDAIVNKAIEEDLDYCSNTLEELYPDGQDVEVFKFTSLEKAWKEAILISDREHVTPFIKKNSSFLGGNLFKSDNYPCDVNYNRVRLTVDEYKDFQVIEHLIKRLGTNQSWINYTNEYLNSNINRLNSDIERNEGYKKSLNQDKK